MSWDDDDFETKLPPGAAEPPASWEDEVDKTLTEEVPEPTVAGPAAPVVFKAKHAAKEKKKAEEAAVAASRDDDEGPTDPIARKKWIEEKQKAADLLLAVDSFGLGDASAIAAPAKPVAAASPPKAAVAAAVSRVAAPAASASGAAVAPGSLAAATAGVVLGDAASFGVAGARVGQCVAGVPATKPAGAPHALAFVRELVTAVADRLSPDDLQSLRTLLDGFRNKKLQAAKTGVKKPLAAPKKGQKGGRLMMEADDDYLSHAHGAAVGADDYADMGDSGAAPAAGAAPKAWGAVDDFM